jgi:hypothetical protein
MTRSTKKAIINSSKPRNKSNSRREMRKIKELLKFDPDSDILNADSKELGNDDWGTKFDFEYNDGGDEEEVKKMRRK